MALSVPHPFSFLLFGASGHLAKLKIYPALYTLAVKGRLPADYAIIGFARTEMSDDTFRGIIRDSIRAELPDHDKKALDEFLTHAHYQRGEYGKTEDYQSLHSLLQKVEKGWNAPVRLAYLSVPPSVFTQVIRNLCDAGIRSQNGSDNGAIFRCIIEKPVGHDLSSFEDIFMHLTDRFSQDEIFLLDHYLGKEAVRNIYYLRFSNPVLERLLKNTIIRHVEITAFETAGLEGRAGYFDAAGTLRDFFQSHLLLIGALLTMRLQETESGFRESRFSALQQFYLPAGSTLADTVLQGQYGSGRIGEDAVVGYREEEGIDPQSRANTFCALKLKSRTPKWDGVPFYLRSGKRLKKRETRISIQFQESHPVGPGSTTNRLDIILQGEAGMKLFLQTKLAGTEPAFRPLILEDPLVPTGDLLPEHALLILEAIHGKQQWFLTFDEVRSSWRLIDPIQGYLDQSSTPLFAYPAGSYGPAEVNTWIAKDGITWL